MAGRIDQYRRSMIGALIRERKRKGLSQETVASRMGIQRSNLSRFECGEQNTTLDYLSDMLRLWGWSLILYGRKSGLLL